ncbi:IS200/IS605 family transposase [bacterium]|nr:MAG: IS200/IS605 family transposase [bacterium]QQS23342.1 MAG: IS200/IS605 family transposase [bacterium]
MVSSRRLYQLEHSTYRCFYHVVWTPRYRNKALQDKYTKAELKRIFLAICKWKSWEMSAWHIGDDHIHLYIGIPPKYSVAYALAVLKSKSSAWLKKKTKRFPKGALWARGYFVSTVGIDEAIVKRYVQNQEHHQIELPKLF